MTMKPWTLPDIAAGVQDDVHGRLAVASRAVGHTTGKGDASESIWRDVLSTYLPARYSVAAAHVVDSRGAVSRQIDVLIFDRQDAPVLFQYEGQLIVPVESVYAAFETKQTLRAQSIATAERRVASVRSLYRPDTPDTTAQDILGGLVTFGSDRRPPLGARLRTTLSTDPRRRLDLGCVAAHGVFHWDAGAETFIIDTSAHPAPLFLLLLIARLNRMSPRPPVDTAAYGASLAV